MCVLLGREVKWWWCGVCVCVCMCSLHFQRWFVCFCTENRTFKFSLSQFGTMCLLQDAHINMPFQSWELRPHKTNAAVLTIIAAIVELEIEIKVGQFAIVERLVSLPL